MRRRTGAARSALILTAGLVAAAAMAPAGATAASSCVGGPGCYATLQEAVDAAHDGDRITINPGTYAGGVMIPVSIRLAGAGADTTTISGGGPVLTIGTFGSPNPPTVVISGVTITGGVTTGSAVSVPWTDAEGVVALGGGVEIPAGQDFAVGATVTIKDSVITGNRVAPSATAPLGPPCPNGPCPFALAAGGGLDSWGSLTLVRTTVTDNRVGTAAGLADLVSDAEGAGIRSHAGGLVLDRTSVSHNRATAATNGRYADGGGVFISRGTFDMDHSDVSDNEASLDASMPDSVDVLAIAGGIHLGGAVSRARITDSTIDRNTVRMANDTGVGSGFSGGLHVDWQVPFTMGGSSVSSNLVSVRTLPGSSGDASADSGAGEIHGKVSDSRFADNAVSVESVAGNAYALGGATIFSGTISNSVVTGNSLHVASPTGSAWAAGGALLADEGGLTVRDTAVDDNLILVTSSEAPTAQGGAIYDAPIPDGPPGGPLKLIRGSVAGNAVSGSPGATLEGGGIYLSGVPVNVAGTTIEGNVPDQCSGFTC